MSETNTAPPGPNVAIAKGIALGLGVLLIAGTLLLIAMLVARGGDDGLPTELPAVELGPGERVAGVSLDGQQALLLIEHEDGSQRMLLIHLTTGRRAEGAILSP